MFFVLLLYALFGSVFTIGKIGLQYSEPVFFVGARMLFAGILLLAYQLLWKKESLEWRKLPWGKIFLLALCGIYLTNIFEFWGLQYLTSFKTCLIYSLSPFLAALLAYLMFSERMTWRKWLGLGIGCIGLLPTLLTETSLEEQAGQFFIFSWAELAVLMATLTSVYGWSLLRQLVKEEKASPFTANGLSMILGGLMALVHSSLVEEWNPIPVTSFLPFFECSLLLILISNLVCYNLYGSLLKRFSTTFMSLAGFTTPFFAALFGWIFLNEIMTWPFYISIALQLAALLVFYQEELQQESAAVPQAEMGT